MPIRTRAGSNVTIYNDQAPGPRPWHGAYEAGEEGWMVCSWLSNGRYMDSKYTSLDLVFEPVPTILESA
jgi:hypothetical protein